MVIALSSHLTHVKPSPPVVIDQPDLFTHLFQGVFSFFFCLPHNMGLVRKVCFLWGAFLWNTKDRKMWNCFFIKKMNSFIFMKKVVFTRFFSYTTLIWGSGDYWMGKQIQFIWLVRRRGGVGIRSWIYILRTTQQYSSKWLVWFPGQEDVGVDRLQAVLLELLLCLNQHQVNNRLLFRARIPLSEGW